MKRKLPGKSLAFLLALIMTLGLLPLQALADGESSSPIITTDLCAEEGIYTVDESASPLQVSVTPDEDDAISYQWYSNTISSTSDGTLLECSEASYTPLTSTPGTTYYYVLITNLEKDKTPVSIYSSIAEVTVKAVVQTTFSLSPMDSTLVLQDSTGTRIWPDESGCYELLDGESYTYVATKYGYVSQNGTVTGGMDTSVTVTLSQAAENSLTQYTGYWTSFRGNSENMGVTGAETPIITDEAYLKWAKQYNATPPIILNGELYIASGSTISRIDKNTGEKLATSESLQGGVGYALNPITYGEGMLFVPIGNGRIQALNAETLGSLWVSETLGGQTLCPITYHNGYVYSGTWNSETADGSYFCLSVTDEDTESGTETKLCTWTLTRDGGFYWAGAYATDHYVIFGSDDGTSTSVLYSVDPVTGEEIDTITEISGDIRSTVSAVVENGITTVYFTTKGGIFGKVQLNGDGTFDDNTYQTYSLGGASTGTPLVINGVAFIGTSARTSTWGYIYKIIDVSTMELITSVDTVPAYVQASALLSTAYVEDTGKVYVYVTYNACPGGVYMIAYDINAKTAEGSQIFDPTGTDYEQFCICSLVCDSEGTIYYKNDSGYLMAISNNPAYLTELTADTGNFKTEFSAGTTDYELAVPSGAESVTLSFAVSDGSEVKVSDETVTTGSATIALANSAGTAVITVTNGTKVRIYTVIIRGISTDAALSELIVGASNSYMACIDPDDSMLALTPVFTQDTYDYTSEAYDRTFHNVWPTTNDPNAAINVYAVANVKDRTTGTYYNTGDEIPVKAATSYDHSRYAVYFMDDENVAVIRVCVTAEDGVTQRNYRVVIQKTADSTAPTVNRILVSKTGNVAVKATDNALLHEEAYSFDGGVTWQSSNSYSSFTGESVEAGTIQVRDAVGNIYTYQDAVDLTTVSQITVTVGVYDYTAMAAGLTGASETGVIMNYTFSTDYGNTTKEILAKAFSDNSVSVEGISDGYVSSINGLGSVTGYSGWCMSYNNDDYANSGIDYITIGDGDTLRFDYTCNFDTTTDDIGNGWYGLPIVTEFTLAGHTVTMTKSGSYDDSWNYVTSYYISGNQNNMIKISGSGTSGDPFIIPVTVSSDTDLTSLTATYKTSLNENYRIVSGLSEDQDYSSGLNFNLSSLGGTNIAYYTVTVTQDSSSGGSGSGAEEITVKFRLIGATLSDGNIDLGIDDYEGSEYVTWIKTKSYTLDEDSTVYDLFTEALTGAGLRSVGADSNYVSTIYAPAVLGGYALSEFVNGKYSGWMYTVDGDHPAYGLNNWVLEDGDTVVWHYVNDYRYEVKDWFSEDPNYSSLGDGTYWSKWLEAPDVKPQRSGDSSVNSSSSGSSSALTLSPAITASNGTAAVTLSASDLSQAAAQAAKTGGDAIVIAPEITGTAAKVTVELPKASVSSIASETDANLTVETLVGTITLPNEVLSSIVSQATGSTVTVSLNTVETASLTMAQQTAVGENPVFDISILSGDSHISGFYGGSISISLPYTLKDGETGENVTIWYLSDAGELINMTCIYDKATGLAVFTTTHLSVYIVGYENWTNPFTDILESDWFYDAVKYANKNGLMSGTREGAFNPNANMTRAMLVTVLYRLDAEPSVTGAGSFTDVADGSWYADAVEWANANDIISGYGGGLFGTNDNITREQLAVILYNYAGYKGYDTTKKTELTGCDDADSIAGWALPAMKWAKAEGLINGRTTTILAPGGEATRTEAASSLMRFCENIIK